MSKTKTRNIDYKVESSDSYKEGALLFWQKVLYALLTFIVLANFIIIFIQYKYSTTLERTNNALHKTIDGQKKKITDFSNEFNRIKKKEKDYNSLRKKVIKKTAIIGKFISDIMKQEQHYNSCKLIGFVPLTKSETEYNNEKVRYTYNLKIFLKISHKTRSNIAILYLNTSGSTLRDLTYIDLIPAPENITQHEKKILINQIKKELL